MTSSVSRMAGGDAQPASSSGERSRIRRRSKRPDRGDRVVRGVSRVLSRLRLSFGDVDGLKWGERLKRREGVQGVMTRG
jgi:hypothetical protein